MLEIKDGENQEIVLIGRFDAVQAESAKKVFLSLDRGRVVDFSGLEYISSAGLGVLLAAQKRLSERGEGLRLVKVNPHIRDIFRFSGFDQIFEID